MSRSYLKAMVLASAVLATTAATAATVGPFVDLSAGVGMIHTPDHTITTFSNGIISPGASSKRDLGGFAWRIAGGYNFSKYFGAEAAYLRPAESSYKAVNGSEKAKLTYNDNIAEVLADGYWPASKYVDFYGKLGLAYIDQKVSYHNDYPYWIPVNTGEFTSGLKSGNYHKIAPVVAVGAGYNVTKNIMLNTGVSYIYSDGDFKKKKDAVASVSYLSLGLRYTL